MNKQEFMQRLEAMLQDLPPSEKEEALQYYNDYLDDAGVENEAEVLKALGSPEQVADQIRKSDSIAESFQDIKADDHKMMKYGEAISQSSNTQEKQKQSEAFAGTTISSNENGDGRSNSYGRTGSKRQIMPTWVIVLCCVVGVLAAPVWIPILFAAGGILLAIVITWFSLIFAFGVTALALFGAAVILLVVGVICVVAEPVIALGVFGGALICAAVGLLFMMLTVCMAGILTPMVFKIIGKLATGK